MITPFILRYQKIPQPTTLQFQSAVTLSEEKDHCLKGYKCDFSHNINSRHLQSNYKQIQRPLFYKQNSHPYHIYPSLINHPVHPYNNHPFMQPLMDIPTKWPRRR